MSKRQCTDHVPQGWERVCGIFDNPRRVLKVRQRQFDYFDEVLERLAATPLDQIDFADLWCYHHDLAHVELQQDLFDYLFPACLMDWRETLMNNQACSHGDSEFHYGIHHGDVLETMMAPERREAVFAFFRDAFLERLDAERGFVYAGSKTPAYGWIARFNSLGLVMPEIALLWRAWWLFETPGRAVAALQYCSGLMYFEDDNPLFPPWTQERGGGGPYIWMDDSMIFHLHFQ